VVVARAVAPRFVVARDVMRATAAVVIAPRGFVAVRPRRATPVRAFVARFETARVMVAVRDATF